MDPSPLECTGIDSEDERPGRRQLLEALGAGGAALAVRFLVPAAWVMPVVLFTPLPAHAACSNFAAAEPPAGSKEYAVSIVAKLSYSSSKNYSDLSATIVLPTAAMPIGTQYRLYVRDGNKCTIGLRASYVAASPNAELATVKHYQPEVYGDVAVQLRWDNIDANGVSQAMHSPWVSAL